MSSNSAAVLYAARDLRISEWEVPQPAPHEVRIRMRNVGICGSDVHYWWHGHCGPFILRDAMVIGHECAGVVEAVGSAVRDRSVGQRVAVEPGVPCGRCGQCRGGRYNLCGRMQFMATPPVHGALARYVCHAADFCYPLPDGLTLEEGALCEPLSVAVHANDRAGTRVQSRVVVLGAGPIGLACLMVAKAYGAVPVVVTDVSEQRLQVARYHCGADAVVCVREDRSEAETVKAVRQALGGDADGGDVGADAVIDCCGAESTMRVALQVAASGGRVCLVGMAQDEMRLPLVAASTREVDVVGVFRYRNTYPRCIGLLASGKLNARALITHRLKGLDAQQLLQGFEMARTGADGAIKVMFDVE
ncbi:hypothetical protein CDCA_CDCA19G4729 [Cyanidium caldarium]|uniref:Enoyl reductase (ER) domain-containing protein n=1 Tax=Cyanidium caldarium TaxID=2771 RepID=A0AAV9J2C4_CYACA|nr:hypothetical protein CDCA_CDCA19G4729 [Cyanidium caldarium]